ncbi:MG2 domain-containing protein [Algivirga pacifica]|uniref:TonB-dependent outer membrane receptor, SusC/RagA subfamily, signature region n=1 Tax=Algivirga pacifica TaxID=1162670 RepID=A0ABP9DAZ1_9BACT
MQQLFRNKGRLFPLLFFGLVLMGAFPIVQNPLMRTIQQKLKLYHERLPQEKVYLQLDKPIYKPGETIWVKGYLRNGSDLSPTGISDIAYIDLIDPKGNTVQKLTLQVLEGGFEGSFDLEKSSVGGNYRVKAYTHWMQNFDNQDVFEKELQVMKLVKPRLLMKLDFQREAYGPGDEVTAEISIRMLNDEPLRHMPVDFLYSLNGKKQEKWSGITDEEGMLNMAFQLPENLMTNDGLLNVQIGFEGTVEAISRAIPIVLNDIDLQFFPEGGEWIAGKTSRIAFKALNEFGKPADIKGVLLDAKGNQLLDFESFHQGMGALNYKAKAGEVYSARITHPKGIEKEYTLPAVKESGFGIHFVQQNQEYLDLLYSTPNEQQGGYAIVQHGGTVYYSKYWKGTEEEESKKISLKGLPMGVLQLTLFDEKGVAQAERLFFNQGHEGLSIELKTNKKQYGPREEITLELKTTNQKGRPVSANVAVAVVDDKILSVADDQQHTILSWLLVGSDLKGSIEEPAFYFDPEEEKAAEALDYLMLTHGWRRFTWEELNESDLTYQYSPEKENVIAGQVINTRSNKPLKTTVQLFEMERDRRTLKVQTDKNGRFVFVGINPSVGINLLAEVPKMVNRNHIAIKLTKNNILQKAIYTTSEEEIAKILPVPEELIEEVDLDFEISEDIMGAGMDPIEMEEEVERLDEVVVTAFGVASEEKALGYSVVNIRSNGLDRGLTTQEIGNVLQGKVAGVQVTEGGGQPQVMIRGNATVGVGNKPLYILDGIPVAEGAIYSLSPEEIGTVAVMKGNEATALYGSAAQGGVILINTHKGYIESGRIFKQGARYVQTYIKPSRDLSKTRAFYMPKYSKKEKVKERTDFRETILWLPTLITGEDGKAMVKFFNSDDVTTFRVTAEGVSTKGLVGRKEHTFSSQLSFGIETKVPAYLTMEDTVHIPIFLKNNTAETITGILEINSPLESIEHPNRIQKISPYSTKKVLYKATATRPKKGQLEIAFRGDMYQDKVSQPIEVKAKGFSMQASYAGMTSANTSFILRDPVNYTTQASLVIPGNMTEQLMDGVASIIREPYGCFEQVSSSTYPNLMALQLMEQTGYENKEVKRRALAYIKKGYKKLKAYETKKGGFEWFGNLPPHEALTAYGLLEFSEMKPFYKGVEDALIERTKKWLLDRRDGKGGFKQSKGKYDAFGQATEKGTNAYIVYVLARIGEQGIQREFDYAYQEALQSKDAYGMALMANAAYLLEYKVKGDQMLSEYLKLVKEDGYGALKGVSITQSGGRSLQIEIASLGALAMLRQERVNAAQIAKAADYIISNKSFGRYGATQSTILALEFLVNYSQYTTVQSNREGHLLVYVNNKKVAEQSISTKREKNIIIEGLEAYYSSKGKQEVKVELQGIDSMQYTLDTQWSTQTPQSDEHCMVDLSTSLLQEETQVGNTCRLTATIKNKQSMGLPMVVAKIGIPSGLSIQPWQLKALKEEQKADFVELFENYVVLYFTSMGPEEVKEIHLDLRAEVGGQYGAPASTAYLYYTNEAKDWEAGQRITIRSAETVLPEN